MNGNLGHSTSKPLLNWNRHLGALFNKCLNDPNLLNMQFTWKPKNAKIYPFIISRLTIADALTKIKPEGHVELYTEPWVGFVLECWFVFRKAIRTINKKYKMLTEKIAQRLRPTEYKHVNGYPKNSETVCVQNTDKCPRFPKRDMDEDTNASAFKKLSIQFSSKAYLY